MKFPASWFIWGTVFGAALFGGCLGWQFPTAMPAIIASPATGTSPSTSIDITVDWQKVSGLCLQKSHFGLNLFKGSTLQSQTAAYTQNLKYMSPGIVRIHHADLMTDSATNPAGLLQVAQRRWDRDKLKKIFAVIGFSSPQIMLNIPGWPQWMDRDKDGYLDRDQFDAFAKLTADLVRIVDEERPGGVKYWEMGNEWDDRYYTRFHQNNGAGPLRHKNQPDRWDEVSDIYRRCARAMKKVNPHIQVGGPACARPDLQEMKERFIQGTASDLDFFTVHYYACGEATTPDRNIYQSAEQVGNMLRDTRRSLEKLIPCRQIPVMLDEFNISWTWETQDPRMTNNKGAVFDALVYLSSAESGTLSALAWNEKDGVYGKISQDDIRRPGAEALHLLTHYLTGPRVTVISTEPQTVVAIAVSATSDHPRSLLLIHRSDGSARVRLRSPEGKPLSGTVENQISAPRDTPSLLANGLIVLPAHSLTLLNIQSD